jgi:hypothetical protein
MVGGDDAAVQRDAVVPSAQEDDRARSVGRRPGDEGLQPAGGRRDDRSGRGGAALRAQYDPAKVREALLGGFAGSKTSRYTASGCSTGPRSGFRIRLHRKDARIVEVAAATGTPIPSFAVVADCSSERSTTATAS